MKKTLWAVAAAIAVAVSLLPAEERAAQAPRGEGPGREQPQSQQARVQRHWMAQQQAQPQPQPQGERPAGREQARPGEAQQETRPTFRAEANFVRLDVYPLAGGKPVADLVQADFQIFEDNAPQEIATFERVVVRSAGAQDTRVEPQTVGDSRQMAQDPRARLFVLFIDTYHITQGAGYNVRAPLVRMLDRTIGQDDLVAVMTPEMSAGAISFARRTGSIEELLGRYWDYAKREQLANLDPEESTYAACYPAESASMYSEMAIEMINRRREKMTLSALEDLIVHLHGLREERKAILTVSEGWALYRPNSNLARAVEGRVPGPPAIGVGPDGRLRSGDLGRSGMGVDLSRCDSDRIALAQDDNDREFRRLLDLANRANASFYPIDPRGLPVFDTTIGLPGSEQNPTLDQARLKYRIETLRTLADATDGIAIVNSNNIDAGLTRVVDDLSSYYLLGYYSSNSKPDGRFRSITVRVKRPGVTVRTRRGYLAPTREEVEARTAASASPAPATPVEVALRGLPRPRLNTFVHSIAGYAWRSASAGEVQPVLWLSGELDATAGSRDEAWKNGGEVSLTVTGADKAVVGEGQYKLSSQNRFFQLRLPGSGALAPGDYSIRVTSKPAGATLGSSETVRVHVPSAPSTDAAAAPAPPWFFRRGPFSGAGWKPVGDMRFRRQERAKMEVAIVGPFDSFTMKLLDRNGNALNVPVAPSERTEEGSRVIAGEVTLAPLAAGDYIIEATIDHGGKSQKVLGAFRVIQ